MHKYKLSFGKLISFTNESYQLVCCVQCNTCYWIEFDRVKNSENMAMKQKGISGERQRERAITTKNKRKQAKMGADDMCGIQFMCAKKRV